MFDIKRSKPTTIQFQKPVHSEPIIHMPTSETTSSHKTKVELLPYISNSEKYNYIIKNAWSVRFLNLFALVSYFGVLYGFSEFLRINLWYMVLFGPLFLVVVFAKFSTHFLALFYPQFDTKDHESFVKSYWQNNDTPKVDIFLPLAGEELSTIRNTWEGVSDILYSNKTVYVLDDKADSNVESMAREFGFTYISRPNRGEYKKSGNIQYGLEHSTGEYIFILDADFRPIPEALIETIPYISSNSKISILQTPQYFDTTDHIHKKSPIQYGAGSVVEEFYRILLPSQMRFGSGKCVGTSAVYRRQALLDAGGMPKDEGSEDIRIGLETHKHEYEVSYLPLVISKGVCPDNIQSYFKQQSRWAAGTISTIFSHYFIGKHLDFWGKLTYLNSLAYYFGEMISPILAFQILALLYFNTESIKLSWIIPFLPYLFYFYILRPKFTINKTIYGSMLAGLTHILAYTDALIRLLFRKTQKWVAAGSKSKKFRVDNAYFLAANISILYMVLYIGTFCAILMVKPYILLNIETYTVLFIALLRSKDFLQYSFETIRNIRTNLTKDVKEKIISPVKFYSWQFGAVLGFVFSVLIIVLTLGYNLFTFIENPKTYQISCNCDIPVKDDFNFAKGTFLTK